MSANGLSEDEILRLIEGAEGEDLTDLTEKLEAMITMTSMIGLLDQVDIGAGYKEKQKKQKSKEIPEPIDDVFVCEYEDLRITWTKNEDGDWTFNASNWMGKGEDGALRGQYSKELETAIWFSFRLLKKHIAAKVGGHAKAGKSNHPYKELILKHMKNSKGDGNSLKQFLLQWESNPLERNITLKQAGEEKYEVSDVYEDSPSKTYKFRTFENYWGECK